MNYYKCLVNSYYTWDKNSIHSEDSMDSHGIYSLNKYVKDNPDHWELVTTNYEVY